MKPLSYTLQTYNACFSLFLNFVPGIELRPCTCRTGSAPLSFIPGLCSKKQILFRQGGTKLLNCPRLAETFDLSDSASQSPGIIAFTHTWSSKKYFQMVSLKSRSDYPSAQWYQLRCFWEIQGQVGDSGNFLLLFFYPNTSRGFLVHGAYFPSDSSSWSDKRALAFYAKQMAGDSFAISVSLSLLSQTIPVQRKALTAISRMGDTRYWELLYDPQLKGTFFFQCWGSNPGPCTCWTSALPMSYTLRPSGR